MPEAGRFVRVRGQVQGVGFRPHVWRLAKQLGLGGHVLNDGAGVAIEVWGEVAALEAFLDRIEARAPPMAVIRSVAWRPLSGAPATGPFRIVESGSGPVTTGVAPDTATCGRCLAEVFDPGDRRHGYAFTNCADCGPRMSIVNALPYDRSGTSMASFEHVPGLRRRIP